MSCRQPLDPKKTVKTDTLERSPTGPIRLLIADGHPLLRRGLSMLLNVEPDLAVVGVAANGSEALDMALALQPDVVLADECMPQPDGIALAEQLQDVLPQTKIVVVSMNDDSATALAAMAAGASGFVVKRATGGELLEAIRAAAAGDLYLDPFLQEMP